MTKRNPEDIVSTAKTDAAELAIAKAKAEASKWRSMHREAAQDAVRLERRLDALLEIQGATVRRKRISVKRSKAKGVAVIAPATDWHVEETVHRDSVNGKNHYDLAEAERRIKRFYAKVIELIDWQSGLAPVIELWHPLLGDLLTGYIHEELIESNSLSPTEACVFLQDMICSGIDYLLKETALPIYVPTCVGNHGRTTPRKRIKTSAKNSYEWLLYMTLAQRYARDKRVHFMVGRGYHNTQEIMGRKVRFHHGDGLRYHGGVGGISIPVNKAVSQWDKVSAADFDVFGHWHTHLFHYPKWISCGSLMGYSEYSVEIKAEFQHPTQAFIVIDRAYGITQATPIFLTKPNRI